MLKIADYCAEVGAKCVMRDSAATAKRQRISVLLAADAVEPVEGVGHEERQPYGDADRCGNLDIMSVQRTQPTARLEFNSDRTRTGLTMVYQDLRAFLAVLKQSGELVDISRPIALKYDVATALAKSNSVQGPALMFRETGTAFPLVAGLYATRKRALLAFDATEASIHDRVLKGIDNPIGPVDFEGAPPCQEVMLTGEQIDLTKLPVPTYSPKDGSPYITAGIVISENPETSEKYQMNFSLPPFSLKRSTERLPISK
jgi:hypothetical protein